ncbi:aa3-type cytochrome oxidase subunit CtaJ [Mycolicibacterium gadium]|uniref:Secreted protein n=2 Tax=Mycolicibacterium gadium TaxID=1794 RepID=A0ABT6GW02_MYCGU|nr:hypothetical protein [Mycolicibacterium gadium]MDG5485428.1 hypothetical protein [Mycolicibacterium gadium]
MSTALTHSLLGGVPLAVLLVLMFLIYVVGPKRKGPHPATYKMSDKWTHDPILWAADEPADHGHGAGHGSHPVTVGGGASGKW